MILFLCFFLHDVSNNFLLFWKTLNRILFELWNNAALDRLFFCMKALKSRRIWLRWLWKMPVRKNVLLMTPLSEKVAYLFFRTPFAFLWWWFFCFFYPFVLFCINIRCIKHVFITNFAPATTEWCLAPRFFIFSYLVGEGRCTWKDRLGNEFGWAGLR